MGVCHTRPSPSQEPLSDSSESSTKVFPPTRRNTPTPSVSTRSRLNQIIMCPSYSYQDGDAVSGINGRGDPHTDDLLTRHFRFDGHGTPRGLGEGMKQELAEMGKQAEESRVARVRAAMEKQDRTPSTAARHGSHPAEPIPSYHPYTPPATVGDANSVGYYQPSIAATQQSQPESAAHTVGPKSSSNRRPHERPHRRRDTPSRQYEGSNYGRQ